MKCFYYLGNKPWKISLKKKHNESYRTRLLLIEKVTMTKWRKISRNVKIGDLWIKLIETRIHKKIKLLKYIIKLWNLHTIPFRYVSSVFWKPTSNHWKLEYTIFDCGIQAFDTIFQSLEGAEFHYWIFRHQIIGLDVQSYS